jgi:hypothetical protein
MLAVAATLLLGCSQDEEPAEARDVSGDAGASSAEVVALDSGVQIHVGGPEIVEHRVEVPVEVFNGYSDEVQLAASEPELTDNADNRYEYLVSDTNQDLLIPSGEILQGRMVFELVDDRWDDEEELAVGTRFHLRLNPYSSGHPQAEVTDLAPQG